MFFGLFGNKKVVEEVKETTRKGFEEVKKDINAVSGWIKHLDSEKKLHKNDITELKASLSSVKDELEEIRNIISFMNQAKTNRVFKTPGRVFNKQTGVLPVQTAVQTAVQTPNLDQFSVTERAILWVLLNSDMRLSYDDLATMLGKERSTIRGQLNRIKQKNESILEEIIETNGKKRVFIPEEIREKLLKKQKVRVRKAKNSEEKE